MPCLFYKAWHFFNKIGSKMDNGNPNIILPLRKMFSGIPQSTLGIKNIISLDTIHGSLGTRSSAQDFAYYFP